MPGGSKIRKVGPTGEAPEDGDEDASPPQPPPHRQPPPSPPLSTSHLPSLPLVRKSCFPLVPRFFHVIFDAASPPTDVSDISQSQHSAGRPKWRTMSDHLSDHLT